MIAAFFLTLVAALLQFAGMILTAGLSAKWSAAAAGNALMLFGGIELLGIVLSLLFYRWLARKLADSAPPRWSSLLLAVLLAGGAAVQFLIGMVLMNR